MEALNAQRTRGDGMETSNQPPEIITKKPNEQQPTPIHRSRVEHPEKPVPGQHSIYRGPQDNSTATAYPPAINPKGKIFNLIPRLIQTDRPATLKNKIPKFIPYEPYKAATKPIIPNLKNQLPHRVRLPPNRNNLDLGVLVEQMATMKSNEMNDPVDGITTDVTTIGCEWTKLREERDYFEKQLKFQAQVNAELKNLLVAAVGEDLQTRVNVLTEDKLHLARALLSSAQNLSSHTEQIEYLAGQSEVWRSKFLASSLMVEELARWKASLSDKNHHLTESNRQLLETISTVRDMSIGLLNNLKFLRQLKIIKLPSTTVLDLTAECLNISEQLILHSGIGMPDNEPLDERLETMTAAEKLAIEALQNSNQPLMATDEAFKAIVNQAFPSSEQHLNR